ncbi:ANKL1 protein, partial [Sclerurus mexicanus]|nr:ANKL1 protein [Sclerurus mexicanus]
LPDPGGRRRALSFLTEDDTDGSVSSGLSEDDSETGPLSSTRGSLVEKQELGRRCVPSLRRGCPPEPPSLPQGDPRGSALPPQPLASSTLLLDGDELQEGPLSSPGDSSSATECFVSALETLEPSEAGDSPSRGAGSSPVSSPTVLLVPGDQGHPQSPPKSSPTVLLCPGDPGPLQSPPSGPRGSPHPKVLERGSGRHLGIPSVPLSPTSCDTHCSGRHRGDKERGQAPSECHSPGTEATTSPEDATGQDGGVSSVSSPPLSDQSLRRRLRERHSPELAAALRTGHIPDCAQDELALARQFERPDRSRHWREGLVKSSFNYLLLDPRTTQALPLRSPCLSPAQRFRTFVSAVFYVGKGTRARPFCHLAEALGQHRAGTRRGCPKVQRILEIWESGHGVISVLCFQNRVPAEAYTREGCMVEALGLQTLTNQRKGQCYGVAAGWAAERRQRLGVHMLYRAMSIFLAEGERQLRPGDFPGG